ncbi:hypothetical protein [Haloglomus salinum]|jgi:hypothetical protein|uniref:hypothetical protein n=1 Tax=Haloglomus salinum TaxID=2962673 RepID=UPI0020CA11D3|nr:hypothetical protein [Haloglomus salinum]
MPVRNTACPVCGAEALVNVPDADTKIRKVEPPDMNSYPDTKAACKECGDTFYAWYS